MVAASSAAGGASRLFAAAADGALSPTALHGFEEGLASIAVARVRASSSLCLLP